MSAMPKTIPKIVLYLFIGIFVGFLIWGGVSVTILRNSISMTAGSCKTLFSDLDSKDAHIRTQARRFAENAVREVRHIDKAASLDDKVYSDTVRDLSAFCDKHPTKNLLQLEMAYLGLDDHG